MQSERGQIGRSSRSTEHPLAEPDPTLPGRETGHAREQTDLVTPAVEFRNVSYAVSGRAILKSVSFAVEPAETLALLGRSGSGKTTALKMVNALVVSPKSSWLR